MKFSHSFRVPKEDIDHLGHVNNVAYVRWVQDLAIAHWKDIASEEYQEKYGWMIVRHELDYKKQAFENDEITATTWVGEWTHVTCERFVEIYRGEELLVKSRTVWCIINLEKKWPTKIPRELKEKFAERI
jgi:acyl-CoA thioester hydrolase